MFKVNLINEPGLQTKEKKIISSQESHNKREEKNIKIEENNGNNSSSVIIFLFILFATYFLFIKQTKEKEIYNFGMVTKLFSVLEKDESSLSIEQMYSNERQLCLSVHVKENINVYAKHMFFSDVKYCYVGSILICKF